MPLYPTLVWNIDDGFNGLPRMTFQRTWLLKHPSNPHKGNGPVRLEKADDFMDDSPAHCHRATQIGIGDFLVTSPSSPQSLPMEHFLVALAEFATTRFL